jgi:hypothetical protein
LQRDVSARPKQREDVLQVSGVFEQRRPRQQDALTQGFRLFGKIVEECQCCLLVSQLDKAMGEADAAIKSL